MESLSRLIYPSYCLPVSDNMMKKINQNHYNFIWKNKYHYIRKNDIVKSLQDGGLNVIDFESMNGTIKLKWLQSFLKNSNGFWFSFPKMIFESVGGIDFLLKCDFDISKLPLKLADFHKQALQYWKMLYKHNFSPHTTSIWNNRYILINRKSIYYKDWMDQGVWSLLHLFDCSGNLLGHNDFIVKYNILCSRTKYNKIIKAIPSALIQLIKGTLLYISPVVQVPSLSFDGVQFVDKKCNNKLLRSLLTATYFPAQLKRHFLLKNFTPKTISKIRTSYLSYPVSPKVKEIHFKLLNDIYPSNDFLHNRFNIGINTCTFCHSQIETVEHLFFSCAHTKLFWSTLQNWLACKTFCPALTFDIIKYGFQLDDKSTEFGNNNLLLLAKFFIHKCRFLKMSPIFEAFKNELILINSALEKCKFSKARLLRDFILVIL